MTQSEVFRPGRRVQRRFAWDQSCQSRRYPGRSRPPHDFLSGAMYYRRDYKPYELETVPAVDSIFPMADSGYEISFAVGESPNRCGYFEDH